MTDDLNDLSLVVMPGRNPSMFFRNYYIRAHQTWKTVWEEAAKEITDFSLPLYSNEFTRQDEIHCVFHQGKCTSLGFWTILDMSLATSIEDSYFRNWPSECIGALTKNSKIIAKYSYFTVHRDYRQWARNRNFKFPDLQVSLFTRRLENSICSAMTGTTRNERKINEVCLRGGAKILKENVQQHGSGVDLMAWYKDELSHYQPIQDLSNMLWQNRLEDPNLAQINLSTFSRNKINIDTQKDIIKEI